jgi:carbon monoxide dehydrogenase subunit G
MQMNASRVVPCDVGSAWRALNDPEVLKACIPSCESLEVVSPDEYQARLAVRIGPVNAKFSGRVTVSNRVPPTSYTLSFEGQGGAAGFARGSADVTLAAQDAGTRIDYSVKVDVGGKLAQIGSRLVDGAALKMSDDFFNRFAKRMTAPAADPEVELEPPPAKVAAVFRSMWLRLALAAVLVLAMAAYWISR